MSSRLQKAVLFTVFLVLGLLVFVVFSHIRPLLPGWLDLPARIGLIAALLAASVLFRKSQRLQLVWPVIYAFFIAASAMVIDFYLPSSRWLLSALQIPIETPAGLAIDKLDSSMIITICIILFTKLSGAGLGSIFLQKGRLRSGLTTGAIAFFVCAVGSVFIARQFGAQNLSLARIIPWIPWILVFVLGNAFNEELLFRGIFLNKIGLILGKTAANLVLILPFVLHHTGVTYTNDTLVFLVYLIPLAFFWGWITQKTDSIWGSVLFHAGTDIPVILAILSRIG